MPVAAQPADLVELTGQLEQQKVVRLPGATVTVDDGRVGAGLPPGDRVLIAPVDGLAAYGPDAVAALSDWSLTEGVRLTVVEGLWIARFDGGRQEWPLDGAGETARRQFIAYGDATDLVLGTRVAEQPPVQATAAELDTLAVSDDRPGVRVATVSAGSPFVDYASGLAERFPGELVAVAHGGWLEFAGPGRERAVYLRDVTCADVLAERGAVDLVDAVLDRVVVSPRPAVDLSENQHRQSWSVGASQVVPLMAGCAGVVGWLVLVLVRRVRSGRGEARDMRLARAEAFARIEELGAHLLDTEDADPRAGERFATARTLFDQALTADAMAQVSRIAAEGLDLAGGQS